MNHHRRPSMKKKTEKADSPKTFAMNMFSNGRLTVCTMNGKPLRFKITRSEDEMFKMCGTHAGLDLMVLGNSVDDLKRDMGTLVVEKYWSLVTLDTKFAQKSDIALKDKYMKKLMPFMKLNI